MATDLRLGSVTTDVIPILRVADAAVAAEWYRSLGFAISFEHRFEPGFPLYVGMRRGGAQVHLSEHQGDARPDTLVYLWVDEVGGIATTLNAEIVEQPWGREIEVTDPDGNRLRIAEPLTDPDVDTALGNETEATLVALEQAMWEPATRGDRVWMDTHLTDDFTEHGRSGRTYDRAAILALDAAVIDIELPLRDLTVRPLGRDAALVTYVSVQPNMVANRVSVWRRAATGWRLAFHQVTPTA